MRALIIMLAGFMALISANPAVAADAVPADWIEVAAGPMFTVRAPAGTIFERIRTRDAFSGTFHGPGFDLPVEFCYHPDVVKLPEGTKNARDTKMGVDEKTSTVVKTSNGEP